MAGVRRLIVAPDGALRSLPFGVLVTQSPKADPTSLEAHRTVPWLIRTYAISDTPSVRALVTLRRPGQRKGAMKPFVGVGGPVLKGDLPPLPEARDELNAIARMLQATRGSVLLGQAANEASLAKLTLPDYRVVAFATHAVRLDDVADGDRVSEIALVLTSPTPAHDHLDGLLTPSKIARLKLNADFVVLSACDTAGAPTRGADGELSGLDEPFFFAGARSVLVSNWPVWSDAAVQITAGAFRTLKKAPHQGRAQALRISMLQMLGPNRPASFAHPSAWASFTLDGEGGGGR